MARRSGAALRGDRRSRRPSRLLCRPGSCRRQRRSRDLQILRRRLRAADQCVAAPVVLRARTQPDRRCRDRTRDADAGAGALSPVDRGSAQGQAVSARGSRRAAVSREIPERLCRLEPAVRPDHLGPALQGRGQGTGDRADAEPACRTATAQKRKAAGQALAKTFKANERTFALITNTLAKDKEISDRWRGFQDVADSRHLNNRVEREVVDALVGSVRAAYPRLSHRYYQLKAGWFKKKKLAHWDRNAPLPFAATGSIAWPEAKNMVLTAYRGFSPEMAEHRRALLHRSLDRCAGAARQGAGRVLASDHAVGAPLCADELSGQAARRDDARP